MNRRNEFFRVEIFFQLIINALMHIVSVFALLATLLPLQSMAKNESYWVKSIGDRSRIMHENNLDGTLDLSTLKGIPHLYALGPLEHLQGEITIDDSLISISTIVNAKPFVAQNYQGKAIFLLYASVAQWDSIRIEQSVHGLDAIEALVKHHALAHGLNIHQSFPFRIEGTAKAMTYHIIFKTSDQPHNPKEHHKAKHAFTLNDKNVNVIGFWVDEQHVGKLTHREKHTHMHMRLPDHSSSGHIDALTLKKGATLHFPAH